MAKIIFIDVDGTLVNYENKVPQSAVMAVQQARSKGNLVYLSTGRSKAEMPDFIWNIGFDGMIGGNGSYIESNNKIVAHKMISLEDCTKIVDYLNEKNLAFYLESNNGLFASKTFETEALKSIREYAGKKGMANADSVTVKDIFTGMFFNGELYRNDVNKISYALKSYNDFIETKSRFDYMQNGTWGGTGETALFGDIGLKDITKDGAIKELLEYLNADVKDTFAFGDAKIDIPMLSFCNTGIAMGNGGQEIKAMADYITDDVDNDGLYKAFEYFNLI